VSGGCACVNAKINKNKDNCVEICLFKEVILSCLNGCVTNFGGEEARVTPALNLLNLRELK
jgi:hypothetical protein